jgi:ERF superfamily
VSETQHEPGQSKLAEALSKFQGAVGTIQKNKRATIGTQYSYAYADLATIAEQAYPELAKHGLSFTAKPTMSDGEFVLEYALMHESGEEERGTWPLPHPRSVDIKQIGIAITYARRYCFSAATGIVTEEDTDTRGAPEPQRGQRDMHPKAQAGRERAQARKASEPVPVNTPDAQRKAYHAMRDKLGWDEHAGHDFINEISHGQAGRWTDLDAAGRSFILDRMAERIEALKDWGPNFPDPETGEVPTDDQA